MVVDDDGEMAEEGDGFENFTYEPPAMPARSTIDEAEDARGDAHTNAFEDSPVL